MITLTACADYMLSGQYIARITGRDSKFTFSREFIGRKGGKRGETTEADIDDVGLYERCNIDRKKGKDSSFVLIVEIDGELRKLASDKEDAMIIAKAMDDGRKFTEIVRGFAADPEAAKAYSAAAPMQKMRLYCACDPELTGSQVLWCDVGEHKEGTTLNNAVLQPLITQEMASLEENRERFRREGRPERDGYEILSAKQSEKLQAAKTIDAVIMQCWAILRALPNKEAGKVLSELKKRLAESNLEVTA